MRPPPRWTRCSTDPVPGQTQGGRRLSSRRLTYLSRHPWSPDSMTETDAPSRLDMTRLRHLADRSLAVIHAGQSPTGAYVASPGFPVYRYCWFRDGSFIADAMSRAGEIASAEAFFGWCASVLVSRRD